MAQAISVTPINSAAFGPSIIIGINSFAYAEFIPTTPTTGSRITYTKIGNNLTLDVTEDLADVLTALNA